MLRSLVGSEMCIRDSYILLLMSLALNSQSIVDTIVPFENLSLKGVGSSYHGVILITSADGSYTHRILNPYTNQVDVSRLPEGNYRVIVKEGLGNL